MRRRLLLLALLLGVLLAGAAARLAQQGRAARTDLVAAEDLARAASAQARAGTTPDLAPLQARTRAATRRVDGPLWGFAAHLPVVGSDARAVRRAAGAADALASQAAPPLVDALRAAQGGRLFRDGRVDLDELAAVRRGVVAARAVTARERAGLAAGGGHAAVRHGTARLLTEVVRLDDALATADTTLALAPDMLGAAGPRRYLVAVQNNAEARATGGLVGVVALVTADHGRLALTRTVTNDALHNAARPVPSDPAAARTWTGVGSTVAWFDANLTPHVPDAARNLAGLWQAQMHQRLDGVVLLDAVVLQDLLVAPVRLGSTTLRQADVVDWVARREYVEHPDVLARKALLRQLAGAVFDQATRLRTVQPLLAAARSGHLFLWSAHPDEQTRLHGRLLAGELPAGPFLEVVTQNFGGNKLDYYLQRRVQVRREGSVYAVTLTLTNTAPAGLPRYVTVRADRPSPPVGYAQARVGLSLYAASGAQFERWLVDGVPARVRFDTDHGLTLGTTILEVPRGATVTLTTRLHMGAGVLTYRQQPLLRPDALDLRLPHRVLGS